MGPFNACMRFCRLLSGRFLPFPSLFKMASSKDVNSCPLGMPLNFMPVSVPFFNIWNSRFFPVVTLHVIFQSSLQRLPIARAVLTAFMFGIDMNIQGVIGLQIRKYVV